MLHQKMTQNHMLMSVAGVCFMLLQAVNQYSHCQTICLPVLPFLTLVRLSTRLSLQQQRHKQLLAPQRQQQSRRAQPAQSMHWQQLLWHRQ